MGEAVGQAAAEGQRRSVRRVPMANRAGEFGGTLPIADGTLRVAGQGGVDQPVEVECERDVVVGAPDPPVAIPAIAEHEAFEAVEIGFALCRVDCDAAIHQAKVDQHPEEFPVAVDEFVLAPRNQISGDAPLGCVVQRVPQEGPRNQQGEADGRQLHLALVDAADVAPIVGMLGIGAGAQALTVELPMDEIAAAGGERCDPPQRTGEAFEVGRRPVEMGRGFVQADARPGGREIGQEGCEQRADRALDVCAAAKRIH